MKYTVKQLREWVNETRHTLKRGFGQNLKSSERTAFIEAFGMGVSRVDMLPFHVAREFVRTLGLKSSEDWLKYVASGNCPRNIPHNASTYYKNGGWINSEDWMGYSTRLEKNVLLAEELAKNNKGTLQNAKWLQTNGYSALDKCMQGNRKAFAHIPQNKKRGTIEESVTAAENLAKKNKGQLQNRSWLRKNGYNRLVALIEKYPKKFSHISQPEVRRVKTIKEWVTVAENLTKDHEGTLPCKQRLRDRGYWQLIATMNKYPKSFLHVQQDCMGGKTVKEWVTVAETLAEKNRGTLRNPRWLTDNGYGGLYQRMAKCPKAFSHIRQVHAVQTPQELLNTFVQLAEHSGGYIPSGQTRAYSFVYHHRRLFLTKFKKVGSKAHGKWVLKKEDKNEPFSS